MTLFLPLVIFLLVYGTELLRRWVKVEEVAIASGPLLPVISLTTMFAVAGQFNSTSMLYGLSRHDRMARGLLLEAVWESLGIWLVLPHYGILGVAWVVGMLAVLDRGLYVPWLVCRALDSSFLGYMRGIYLRPVLTAIPVLFAAEALKTAGVSGQTWTQLILMGAFTSVALLHSGVLHLRHARASHDDAALGCGAGGSRDSPLTNTSTQRRRERRDKRRESPDRLSCAHQVPA